MIDCKLKLVEFLEFEGPNSGSCEELGFHSAVADSAQFLQTRVRVESWNSFDLKEVCFRSLLSVHCLEMVPLFTCCCSFQL